MTGVQTPLQSGSLGERLPVLRARRRIDRHFSSVPAGAAASGAPSAMPQYQRGALAIRFPIGPEDYRNLGAAASFESNDEAAMDPRVALEILGDGLRR